MAEEGGEDMKASPSMTVWMNEAKEHKDYDKIGMLLVHNGVVRKSARAKVRDGKADSPDVAQMDFSYDEEKVVYSVERARAMDGIYYVRVWLNDGLLDVGDDIMYVMVGGDTRPHVIEALERLVEDIKTNCVVEKEIY